MLTKSLLKKSSFVLLFVLSGFVATSQDRSDSIKNLTHLSKNYLDALFNKGNAAIAMNLWSEGCFDDLKIGYNNGKITYSGNEDLRRLFERDMKAFLKNINGPISISQTEEAQLFESGGSKYFLIMFDYKNNSNLPATLRSTALDWISKDGGKTWKVSTDHWIKRFMHYLYPPDRPNR